MQSLHDRAFKSDVRPSMTLAGRIDDDAYDLKIFDACWEQPGEASFEPQNYCFLELLYYPIDHLYGTYRDGHADSLIGKLLLVPPGATLYTRWTVGQQKTLSCLFDWSKLSVLGGFDWCWENIELQSTLDVKSIFLEALMTRLAEETERPGFASKLQIDTLLTLIALELSRHFNLVERSNQADTRKLSAAQIGLLREMLESSLGGEPSLTQLASACGLPPRELSERFRRSMGVTLRQFAAETRIRKARSLLTGERYLIKEVAYLCGFQDAAAFTAAFRRKTGLTPQAYRRQQIGTAEL